jgi:hypothetical protein
MASTGIGNPLAKAISAARVQLAEGLAAEAGVAFAELADQAEREQQRRRAANLNAQAAQAFTRAGDGAHALTRAQKALTMMAELDLEHRAVGVYNVLIKQFEARKLTRALDGLRTSHSHKIVILTGEMRKRALPPRKLPETCPGCSIPMRAEAVDWINDARAECDYCGTVVDAT